MRGEDGPHLDLLDRAGEVGDVETCRAHGVHGVGEGRSVVQGGLVEPVHLLGDVDEVEVDREGSRQLGAAIGVQGAEGLGDARVVGRREPDACAAEAHCSTSCIRLTTSALSWRSTVW